MAVSTTFPQSPLYARVAVCAKPRIDSGTKAQPTPKTDAAVQVTKNVEDVQCLETTCPYVGW